MSKSISVILVLVLGLVANAWSQAPKGDAFLGYSYEHADFGSGLRSHAHGYEFSWDLNFKRFFSVSIDEDAHFANAFVPFCFGNTSSTCQVVGPAEMTELWNTMGGLRFHATKGRVTPFARALFGFGVESGCPSPGCQSKGSFTQAYGGGMDFRITDRRFGWRVSSDYVRMNLLYRDENDVRVSTGPVIFFYGRH